MVELEIYQIINQELCALKAGQENLYFFVLLQLPTLSAACSTVIAISPF